MIKDKIKELEKEIRKLEEYPSYINDEGFFDIKLMPYAFYIKRRDLIKLKQGMEEALKLAEQEKEKERKEILEFLKWLIEDKNVEISYRVPEWAKTNIQERINYLEETINKNKKGCGK